MCPLYIAEQTSQVILNKKKRDNVNHSDMKTGQSQNQERKYTKHEAEHKRSQNRSKSTSQTKILKKKPTTAKGDNPTKSE